jgi:hypothetical protein
MPERGQIAFPGYTASTHSSSRVVPQVRQIVCFIQREVLGDLCDIHELHTELQAK